MSSHIVARDRCYLYIISCHSSVVQACRLDRAALKKPAENYHHVLMHPTDMLWTKSYSVHKAAMKHVIDVILSAHHGKRGPPNT